MRNLRDAWTYLTTGANWGGQEGMWHLLVQQLLLSVTALVLAARVMAPAATHTDHRKGRPEVAGCGAHAAIDEEVTA